MQRDVEPRCARAGKARPRGYAIPFVLFLLLLLTVGIFSFISSVSAGSRATGAALKERQAFYAADDMCRITAVLAQNYLAVTPLPTATGMESYVSTNGGGSGLPLITPANYETKGSPTSVPGFDVLNLGARQTKPLPSGPFEGMIAAQSPLDMKVRVQHIAGLASAACHQKVVLGTVSAFQFFIFSDVYLDWDPVPLMTVRGRVHGNQNICIAGAAGTTSGLKGDRVTSAGGIYQSWVSANVGVGKPCRASQPSTASNVRFANSSSFTTFGTLTKDHTASDWRTFAETTFNGRVLDSVHGVTKLKLPITGQPRVQTGYNLAVTQFGQPAATYEESNLDNQRFVVDPVLITEPQDVREQKLAWKADLRIINGTWYLRDDNDPDKPGTPIWSDHPGLHTIASEEPTELPAPTLSVGQEHLRTQRSWTTTPRRFSYYGYFAAGDGGLGLMTRAATDPPAVLSYGALFRDPDDGVGGTRPYWYPGSWQGTSTGGAALPAGNAKSICLATSVSTCVTTGVTIPNVGKTNDGSANITLSEYGCLRRADNFSACGANHHSALLNATRSGFRSGWIEVRSIPSSSSSGELALRPDNVGKALAGTNMGDGVTDNERDRSRILPINIDLAALQAALKDCAVGELGSYFPKTCSGASGREFNGIVYVTATWRDPAGGSLDGLGDTATSSNVPRSWPFQGTSVTNDAAQPDVFTGLAQYNNSVGVQQPAEQQINEALPSQLCASDVTVINRVYDRQGGQRFRIPACSTYRAAGGAIAAYPNAVRVINAERINPVANRTTAAGALTIAAGVLPHGLTIASNLPVYVLGDVNIETTPQVDPATLPTGDYFVPVLIAGDRVIRQSKGFDDLNARWGVPYPIFGHVALETIHNFEVFSGWLQSEASTGFHDDGIENFMKYNEQWQNSSGDVPSHYFGSMVAGFASVYEAAGTNGTGDGSPKRYGFNAPGRDEGYDFHLDVPEKQPPGAPVYNVQGIFLWEAL